MLVDPYDPVSYWKQTGQSYYDKFHYNVNFVTQELVLLDYLKTLKFKTVLEFGAGFGRITNIIMEKFKPKTYAAVDISPEQLSHIHIPGVMIFPTDIESFKTNVKFDLVIAVEVLMHQLPSQVQSVVDKMISLSKKHIINIDYFTGQKEELEPHNFNHDYFTLYHHKDMTMIPIGKQALFHYVVL